MSSTGFSRNIWSVAVVTKELQLYKRRRRKRKIGRGKHLKERKTKTWVEVWKSCRRRTENGCDLWNLVVSMEMWFMAGF